jgi:transcriptional regulator with XRE-family HTH domain
MPSETAATPGGWGRNIAAARTRAGLTQLQLADLLGGVAPTTVARWEQGTRLPGLAEQTRLARALGVSITELFPRDAAEAELVDTVAAIGGGCS